MTPFDEFIYNLLNSQEDVVLALVIRHEHDSDGNCDYRVDMINKVNPIHAARLLTLHCTHILAGVSDHLEDVSERVSDGLLRAVAEMLGDD